MATPSQLLTSAVATLVAADISSPRPDAEWLLAHALRVGRGRLILVDEVDGATAARFDAMVARRAAREPLQHIIGHVEFGAGKAAVTVQVGPGVFIPRSETELLLAWAIQAAPPGALVADLCAGSGALALGLATARDDVRVLAVEKFASARTWLRRNVAAQPLPVAERIAVVNADVTAPDQLREAIVDQVGALHWPVEQTVGLVVSNPPYVPTMTDGAATVVSAEVAADPPVAVFAGEDGMTVITPMLASVRAIGGTGTVVGIEHDDVTAPAVMAELAHAGFVEIASHADLAGAPRYVTAVQARRADAVQG